MIATIYLVASMLLVASPIPAAIGTGIAQGMVNRPLPVWATSVTGLLGIWYLILIGALFGTLFLGLTAFSVDRDKSTLGFVLLTPLKASSILLGKAIGMLTPAALIPGSIMVWTLLLSLSLVSLVGYLPLVVWGEVVLTGGLVWSALSMSLVAIASLVRNPRQVMVGCYFVVFVVPQVAIQLMIRTAWRGPRRGARRRRRRGGLIAWLATLHMPDGFTLWLIFLALCMVLLIVATLLGIWGVRRMRRGDLAFAASRREN
jgi:hypothetical protein